MSDTTEGIEKNKGQKLHPIYEAAEQLGIDPSIIRLWEKGGLVAPHQTPSGEYHYSIKELEKVLREQSGAM